MVYQLGRSLVSEASMDQRWAFWQDLIVFKAPSEIGVGVSDLKRVTFGSRAVQSAMQLQAYLPMLQVILHDDDNCWK